MKIKNNNINFSIEISKSHKNYILFILMKFIFYLF